jgi:hypothetical protein
MPRPYWWPWLERWGLAQRDPTKIISRMEWAMEDPKRCERFLGELLGSLSGPSRINQDYDRQWEGTPEPCVRFVARGTRGRYSEGVLAAALAYRAVVVTDPLSGVAQLMELHRAQRFPTSLRRDGFIAAYLRTAMPALSQLIPLADADIVVFDSMLPLLPEVLEAYDWIYHPPGVPKVTPQLREILGSDPLQANEDMWALVRARKYGAAVGTDDPKFAASFREWGENLGHAVAAAVEVTTLLPFVDGLTPGKLIDVRRRHEDSLAQFRAAIGSATAELRKLPQGDINATRVRQLTRDYLDGELAVLDRAWHTVRIYRGAAAAVGAVALVSTAGVIGVTGATQANALLPLFAGTSSLAGAAAALRIDDLQLKANGLYLLWEVKHVARPAHRWTGFPLRRSQ